MANNLLLVISILTAIITSSKNEVVLVEDCASNLRMGQYFCPDPSYSLVDPQTQEIRGCMKENKAKVPCISIPEINCTETGNSTFYREMPCKWTNGYRFDTALLLSIFLGMFGVDRFYLGYPAIGLAKLCTFGFMFLGQLVDVILIATQTVGPADGSAYIIPYYGPGIRVLQYDNFTYKLKQDDW